MADKSIGERLKEARSRTGLTQSQVCEEVGIPKVQTLSAYELGKNSPPIDTTFKQLATLYGVTTDWILFGEERANKGENQKSPAEYLAQLVEAADKLGLRIESNFINFTENPKICIDMCSTEYEELEAFSSSWKKFRTLFDEGDLESDEYEALLYRKLPKQLSERATEKGPCETAMENGELPF